MLTHTTRYGMDRYVPHGAKAQSDVCIGGAVRRTGGAVRRAPARDVGVER